MRSIHRLALICAALLVGAALVPSTPHAQFGGLVDKAKKKVTKKADKEAGKAMDKALEGKTASPAPAGKPGEGVWVNYDFVPGARVIFFEDFTSDKVGNFPRRLKHVRGNMEVAEWEGRRWLRTASRSEFVVPLPETLPERFTLEFEYRTGGNSMGTVIRCDEPANATAYIEFRSHIAGIKGGGLTATTRTDDPARKTKPFHCRVMADGEYVKVYSNETRVANAPNAPIGRNTWLRFEFPGTASNPIMLTNLRVAESQKTIYDELEANGRVALSGILFDTDSDVIRPESTPTLEEIGEMLVAHADMSVVIEGHTDDVGDDSHNQDLSGRRAQAVRAYLAKHHGIDAARMTARGLGETKPRAKNDTSEGRQMNRRVELAVAE